MLGEKFLHGGGWFAILWIVHLTGHAEGLQCFLQHEGMEDAVAGIGLRLAFDGGLVVLGVDDVCGWIIGSGVSDGSPEGDVCEVL